MKEGQAGLENVFLFGVLFLFLVGLLFVSIELLSYNYKLGQMQDTVDNLVITANTVYDLGTGSRKTIDVQVPQGISGASITGHAIALNYNYKGEQTSVSGETTPKVVGSIPVASGRYSVEVKSVGNNVVKIGDMPYIGRLNPSSVQFNDMPIIIRIIGEDFILGARIKVLGSFYPDSFVTYISPREIQLRAIPGFFPPEPQGAQYDFIVVNSNNIESNPMIFTVYPAGNQGGS